MDIEIKKLCKSYGNEPVLKDFSYTFKDGSKTAIIGSSGIGKTTLLSILSGEVPADSGIVSGLETRRIGMVFQEDRLCENLTGLLNVKMVTDILKIYSYKDISFYFEKIGLDAASKKPVTEYSGGMKRRVAILRALLSGFDVLIMDEPLKGLDKETKDKVISLILEFADKKTVIVATHDLNEANKLQIEDVINLSDNPCSNFAFTPTPSRHPVRRSLSVSSNLQVKPLPGSRFCRR